MIAYIGLGSNLDIPQKQVQAGILKLGNLPKTKLLQASSLYRTKPWGFLAQPDFINAVVKIETGLLPQDLLCALLDIEKQHGRIRQQKFGPRTLDCDILFYAKQVIQEENLCIPHPGVYDRLFVLLPLFELQPDFVLPNGQLLADWLNHHNSNPIEKIITLEVSE